MSGSFGQRIRLLRNTRGLTLAEVAKATDMSVAMLSRIERDERYASPEAVTRLADFFGVAEERLLAEAVEEQVRNRWGESAVDSLRRARGAAPANYAASLGEPVPQELRSVSLHAHMLPLSDLDSHLEGLPTDAEQRREEERQKQERREQLLRDQELPPAAARDEVVEPRAPEPLMASPVLRRAYRERPIEDLVGPEEPVTEERWFEQAQRGAESALFMATHNWVGRSQQLEPEARIDALEHFAALAQQPLRALRQAAERDPDPSVRRAAARLLTEILSRQPPDVREAADLEDDEG